MEMKTTILLVEDDPASADMLAEMFAMAGYRVERASTAEQAVSAMSERRYNAALVDLSLPGIAMDELIVQLQRVPAKPPIVIFSARTVEELSTARDQLGAAAVLQKPAAMAMLLSTIARVVQGEA
jgi:DNA-binding response OmpR family regulator